MTKAERDLVLLYLASGGDPLTLPKEALLALWREAQAAETVYKTVLEAVAKLHIYDLQYAPRIAAAALEDVAKRRG